MKIVGILPARFGSTRFPGKPLVLIAGKPLIQHVVEQCRKSSHLTEVIVATDDSRIQSAASAFARVEMTSPHHASGSDRIAEVAARLDCDAIINIQGDEPLIAPEVIDAVANALTEEEMSTAATPLMDAVDYDNPNVVKVVCDIHGRALYFSRRTIPYLRDAAAQSVAEQLLQFPFLRHLGIYGFRRETLMRFVKMPVSILERTEKLEQLRALENGIRIKVIRTEYQGIGVDSPEDVARVEAMMRGN